MSWNNYNSRLLFVNPCLCFNCDLKYFNLISVFEKLLHFSTLVFSSQSIHWYHNTCLSPTTIKIQVIHRFMLRKVSGNICCLSRSFTLSSILIEHFRAENNTKAFWLSYNNSYHLIGQFWLFLHDTNIWLAVAIETEHWHWNGPNELVYI